MKSLVILGSTGSVGVSTLHVVRRFPDRFRIRGLVAGRNLRKLASQIRLFSPECVSIQIEKEIPRLRKLLGRTKTRILWGECGASEVGAMAGVDLVVAAIVGSAGLAPTLEAVRAGRQVALANKEVLVMAGEIFVREATKKRVRILPVDSEHSAIFQCLQGGRREEVDSVILTASGGPFLRTPLRAMDRVTVKQALNHPNWKMGPKITVDSATMMNKGLEVMEAYWLFDLQPRQVEVLVHPQSIVHSMVRFQDGSILAQLGIPDMRIPIAYALSWPHRLRIKLEPLSLTQKGELTFLPVEEKKYPSLKLAYQALASGGTMPAVLNAANEVAVQAFLDRRIGFLEIYRVIEKTMAAHSARRIGHLSEILEADRWSREHATSVVTSG